MTHSLIHKILGLALLVGVFCAFLAPSQAVSTSEKHTQSITISKESASTP